jgi:phosphoribosyl 1,2-cyclic phosphodiesterase
MDKKIRICALASGSSGNAYYIEYGDNAILIDVGVSYNPTNRKSKNPMLSLSQRAFKCGISLEKVIAVFVTHEHSDHVRGLKGFCKRHPRAKIYMTAGTAKMTKPYYMPSEMVNIIACGESLTVNDFKIHCLTKPHDVLEPCSFRIDINGTNIGVFTDIGKVTDTLKSHFKLCNAVFLESNYDETMLKNGPYPKKLKDRVSGNEGHLSNRQAHDLLDETQPEKLQLVILSHISENNNTIDKALGEFNDLNDKYTITAIKRNDVGEVYTINN